MKQVRSAKAEQLVNVSGRTGQRRDWPYMLAFVVMFPVLFTAGVVSHLMASRRALVVDEAGRTESIFHAASEDARSAISTAMMDL